MRLIGPACLAALLVLAACEKPAKPVEKVEAAKPVIATPSGFAHDPGFDAAGYYRSATPVQAGALRLAQIAVGAPSDFAEWEAGKREGIFGPIVLEFDDAAAPVQGTDGATVKVRVLPQSYRLYPGEVNFSATDPKLGAVAFDGHFNQATFADAHKTGSSGDATVLTGDLKIGDQLIPDINFVFWAGD